MHSEAGIGWGGQEHRVMAELLGFQKRGCAVWLAAFAHSVIYQRAQEAGIPVLAVDFGRDQMLRNIIHLTKWLRKNRIEVLNPHSSRDGWILGIAGRLARVPLIIRTRHIDVDYPNPFLSRHAYTTFADHVLTTSRKIAAHFQDIFHLADDRVTTLPTGIDLERFSPCGEKADLGLPETGVPVIGMISVLRSWKGHSVFLQAARILKDAGFPARFVIVGEGGARLGIEQQIAELQLSDVISLAGHREDVPAVLRALDVLAIPSTDHEGVPQIGLQALATKTPVVGSDVGGIPEIIQPGVTGRIFHSGDARELARALRETIEHREETLRMVEAGRRAVEASHGIDSMLDQLDYLYHRRLGN